MASPLRLTNYAAHEKKPAFGKVKNDYKMKITRHICAFLMVWGFVLSSMAQSPPPNDNYANRTILSGTDISFSGTLAGATRETSPFEIVSPYVSSATQTVWWEWTAPQSSTVVIEILNPLNDSYTYDALQVYILQNVYTGTSVAARQTEPRFPHNFFSFSAQAGTDYEIQLAGTNDASFNFRLVATNYPYIVENPQTQTISTNDSVMFGVVATGLKPIGYQWQFKGTNLNGETAPMLALNHVLTNQAGLYRVIITNSSGSITSQPANLFVTTGDTISLLVATHPPATNGFSFALLGDVGRRYRILSSTNLTAWTNESSFATAFQSNGSGSSVPQFRSVVSDLTGADVFVIPSPVSKKFLRVAPFHAVNEVCNDNLKMIRFATLLDAYDNQKTTSDSVTFSEIQPYMKNGVIPSCPSGGTYAISATLTDPICTIPIHTFEER